jgi:hypothetical protein
MLQWICGQRRENIKPISQLTLVVSKIKPTQVFVIETMFNYGT